MNKNIDTSISWQVSFKLMLSGRRETPLLSAPNIQQVAQLTLETILLHILRGWHCRLYYYCFSCPMEIPKGLIFTGEHWFSWKDQVLLEVLPYSDVMERIKEGRVPKGATVTRRNWTKDVNIALPPTRNRLYYIQEARSSYKTGRMISRKTAVDTICLFPQPSELQTAPGELHLQDNCVHCQDISIFHSWSKSEVMQVERKWHMLLMVFLLLVTSSSQSGQCMDSKEVKKERRTLLDVILQVIGDSQRDKPVSSRRYSTGLFTAAQDMKFSSREKPFYVPRQDNTRPIEVVPRDVNLKDKFIKHFTGPVKFSSECRTHFHRLYHNTRDCSRPACSIYERGIYCMCCQGSAFFESAPVITLFSFVVCRCILYVCLSFLVSQMLTNMVILRKKEAFYFNVPSVYHVFLRNH